MIKTIIEALENMQANGEFENQPEQTMDFNKLSKAELEWYAVEWLSDTLSIYTKEMAVYDYQNDPSDELLAFINSDSEIGIIWESGDIQY